MALTNMFRELAISKATKQRKLVDSMTEESPIIQFLPMEPASNGLQHKYEELKDVVGAKVVQLDDELPEVSATTELVAQDLSVLGGLIQVGEDFAKAFGGVAKYIMKKMGPILRVTTSNIEKTFIYNTVLPYAAANGRESLAGSVTEDVNFSIMCVKYVEGETGGLYDPEGWGNGKIFDIKALDGGNPTMITGKGGKQIVGYRSRMKTYLGFLMANPRNVSSIRNIDITEDSTSDTGYKALPTEAQIDRMIVNARGNPANTLIYSHPLVLSAMNAYKGGAMALSPIDTNFDRQFYNWNGIRWITSYNFSTVEKLQS